MSCSTRISGQEPTEYVGIVRLVNCYIATHFRPEEKCFISEHPETDIKVAQATAILFAKTHNIPYDSDLREPDRPIITVLKREKKWFPAELHTNKITLLTNLGELNLGGKKQQAINMANVIAISKDADFIPSIGISLKGKILLKS